MTMKRNLDVNAAYLQHLKSEVDRIASHHPQEILLRTLQQVTDFKAKLYNVIGRHFNEMEVKLTMLIDQLGKTNVELEYQMLYDKVMVQLSKTETMLKQNPESMNDQNQVFASVINEKVNNLIHVAEPYFVRLFIDENYQNIFNEDLKKIVFLTNEVVGAPKLPVKPPEKSFLPNSLQTNPELPQSPDFNPKDPKRKLFTPSQPPASTQLNRILSPPESKNPSLSPHSTS